MERTTVSARFAMRGGSKHAAALRVVDRVEAPVRGGAGRLDFCFTPKSPVVADGDGFRCSRGGARVKMRSGAKIRRGSFLVVGYGL